MRLATIPVGYADGYTRRLSGKGRVLIHGQEAPICGNICMDQMMVDVTDIPGVKLGDDVTLMGRDGDREITLEELAEKSGILHYEIQCGLSRWRNLRHIIREEI
jgi:alanine racemase